MTTPWVVLSFDVEMYDKSWQTMTNHDQLSYTINKHESFEFCSCSCSPMLKPCVFICPRQVFFVGQSETETPEPWQRLAHAGESCREMGSMGSTWCNATANSHVKHMDIIWIYHDAIVKYHLWHDMLNMMIVYNMCICIYI